MSGGEQDVRPTGPWWKTINWPWLGISMSILLAGCLVIGPAQNPLAAIAWMASALPLVVLVMTRTAQVLALTTFAVVTAIGGGLAFDPCAPGGREVSGWDYAVIPLGLWVSAVAIAAYAFYAGEWGCRSQSVGKDRHEEGVDVGWALAALSVTLAIGLGVWICVSS